MVYNVYAIKNKVSGLYDGLFLFTNDEHASYDLSRRIKDEQKEIMLIFRVGYFDIVKGSIDPLDNGSCGVLVPFTDTSIPPAVKSPISHENFDKQVSQFQEKISDI